MSASRTPSGAAVEAHAGVGRGPGRRARRAAVVVAAALLLTAAGTSSSAAAPAPAPEAAPEATIPTAEPWRWPVAGGIRITEPWRAPAHAYGAGHRGIDIAADIGAEALAPAAGVVAFAGTVVDRPLLTIDHGGGLVSTLEPVESALAPGDVVSRGEVVGTVAAGGHTAPGALHLGVRLDGEYVNPLLLLGGVPRAILLPCC